MRKLEVYRLDLVTILILAVGVLVLKCINMKRILLFLLLLVILSSCTVVKYAEYADILDYSKYSNDNFFITESNSVSFEYKPIGSVSIEVISGFEKNKEKRPPRIIHGDIYNPEWGNYKDSNYKKANCSHALSRIVDESKKQGANGIINLKFTYRRNENGSITSVYASGMAIKYQ